MERGRLSLLCRIITQCGPPPLRPYTFRDTFLYVPDDLSTFVLPAQCSTLLYLPHTFLYAPPCFCYKIIRRLYVPIRSAPPSRKSRKVCRKVIRSYTCGLRSNDVPAGNLLICVQKLCVPIRSAPPSRNSRNLCHKVIRSYTCGIHSNDVPAGNLSICVQKLYVPIRSVPYLSQITQIVLRSYTCGIHSDCVPAGNL